MANLKDTTIRGDLSVDGAISGGFLKPGDTWSANYWGGSCNRWRNSILC